MSTGEILKEFKNSIISFLDELIDQFPYEGELIVSRVFINDQHPIKSIMDTFNWELNRNEGIIKHMIKERNECYFTENNILNIEQEKFNRFKQLWYSNSLDKEDKIVVWKWIDSFVYLAEKYSKSI